METHGIVVAVCALFLFIFSGAGPAKGNREGDILAAWKATLKDPKNELQSWDPSIVNPCTWLHVTCNLDNTVVRLDLSNTGLSGSISPLLANLTNLQYLELPGNSFTGGIPTAIGGLTNLVGLNLSGNSLSGSIPPSLGRLRSLRFLELFDNKLTGAIPPEIGEAGSLQRLDLYHNQLSGSIPSTLGNLTSLTHLRLHHNALTGEIPAEILGLVRWGNLRILNVSKNKLAAPASNATAQKSQGLAITTIIQDHRAS